MSVIRNISFLLALGAAGNPFLIASVRAADREASFTLPAQAMESAPSPSIGAPTPLSPAAKTVLSPEPDKESAPAAAPVPAAPAPAELAEPVATEKLTPVDADAMGLLTQTSGGLGVGMWDDTPRPFAERLMSDLDLPGGSPTLNSLARRLLLTSAAVPLGESALNHNLTSLRVEKLLALGDVSEAWQLAMMAKPGHIDKITMRLLTEAALIGPDSKELCDHMPDYIAGHDGPDWQKALILCQLRAGDAKAVQVGLDVMREQQVKDDIFVMLVNRVLANDIKRLPRQLTPLRPVTLGLLRQLNAPIPSGLYAHPDAMLIPELLQTRGEDDNLRLILAEKAASRGIISGAQLAAVYKSAAFPAEALADSSTTREAGSRLHALLYQAASQEQPDAKRADLIARFMREADVALLCGAGGQALAELAAPIPVVVGAESSAAQMARLMVLAGKPERSLEWLKLARAEAAKTPEIAAQLQDIWPLLVLAGVVPDAEYSKELKNWMNDMLKESGNDASKGRDQRRQAASVLVMFGAAGFAVPEDAWLRAMAAKAESKRIAVPSPVLLERLRGAGMNNHRGEAVLISILLAGGGADDTPLFVTADAVRALRLVGLTGDAMALARETVARTLTAD
jgi:hypothetical protein